MYARKNHNRIELKDKFRKENSEIFRKLLIVKTITRHFTLIRVGVVKHLRAISTSILQGENFKNYPLHTYIILVWIKCTEITNERVLLQFVCPRDAMRLVKTNEKTPKNSFPKGNVLHQIS